MKIINLTPNLDITNIQICQINNRIFYEVYLRYRQDFFSINVLDTKVEFYNEHKYINGAFISSMESESSDGNDILLALDSLIEDDEDNVIIPGIIAAINKYNSDEDEDEDDDDGEDLSFADDPEKTTKRYFITTSSTQGKSRKHKEVEWTFKPYDQTLSTDKDKFEETVRECVNIINQDNPAGHPLEVSTWESTNDNWGIRIETAGSGTWRFDIHLAYVRN